MSSPHAVYPQITNSASASTDVPFVLHTRIVNNVGGGPEKTILNSPRYLRPRGYRSACLYLYPHGDPGINQIKRIARTAEAEIIAMPDGGRLDWAVIRSLQQLCCERRVAIWHAHDYKTNVLGLLVRRQWPMKLVTTVHGWGLVRRNPLYVTAGKACLPFYDAVVSVSDKLYQSSRRWGVSRRRGHLVPNAIETDVYRMSLPRDAACRELGIDPGRFVVAALGRLSPEKAFDFLIRAVALAQEQPLPIALAIGGEGECRAELERQIAVSGMQQSVHLLGHLDDPRVLLDAADLFVVSSLTEGLPNALLEAMAMSTPVVATRVGGVPTLIDHGKQGLLVPSGDEETLADAITRFAKDVPLRRKVAAAARRRVEESYDFGKRMDTIASIYDAVLA